MKKNCPKCKKVFNDKDATNCRARTFCSRVCANRATMNGLKLKGVPRLLYRGASHPNWKGEDVGYKALHDWVRLRIPEPVNCPACGREAKLDLANLDEKYSRDLATWGYKCRSCHKLYDDAMNGRVAGSKTECIHGHEYVGDNRKVRRDGSVYCRECNNLRAARRRQS